MSRRFQNRQPREGINVEQQHPLKKFATLIFSALILIAALVIILQLGGSWLARHLPFHYETELMQRIDVDFSHGESPQIQRYLNELSERLSANLPLPKAMQLQIHYNAEATFNAYATIGGNLVFYRGLLERMPHENALAMVLAHEIAHVMHRDPIAGLGGGVASMLALYMITGQSGTGSASTLLNQAGVLGSARFTRRMEHAADRAALAAVAATYGHVNGADALFQLFVDKRERDGMATPRWLERFASTHPLDDDRIGAIAEQAEREGWPQQGKLTPLPAGFSRWLGPGEKP